MKTLLLVEDDSSLGVTLHERLIKEGYNSLWAKDLASAQKYFTESKIDLVILDVGLPDGSGFELAESIRSNSSVPFIFVTAQTSAEDRLRGYEMGAEEYIPKPFHLKEFLIRVSHVLENHTPVDVVSCGDHKINFSSMEILSPEGTKSNLPARDFKVLKLLVDRSPKVVSRDEILNVVWGEDREPTQRTIDNTVVRIRQALASEVCIRSVRGVGYQWTGLRGEKNGQ